VTLAIIPARGGSKRIPRKNIKLFDGLPVISFAIEAAKKSKLFDRIIVSTEDLEIAEIAKQCGAEVPTMRPIELSGDHVTTGDVMKWSVSAYEDFGITSEYVCCIYPVNPLLAFEDLIHAREIIDEKKAHFCFPVAPFPSKIERALKFESNSKLTPINNDFELVRTQDIESKYYDAGQFYWGRRTAWLANLPIHNNAVGLVLPTWRAVDIDEESDWARAELAYKFFSEGRQ